MEGRQNSGEDGKWWENWSGFGTDEATITGTILSEISIAGTWTDCELMILAKEHCGHGSASPQMKELVNKIQSRLDCTGVTDLLQLDGGKPMERVKKALGALVGKIDEITHHETIFMQLVEMSSGALDQTRLAAVQTSLVKIGAGGLKVALTAIIKSASELWSAMNSEQAEVVEEAQAAEVAGTAGTGAPGTESAGADVEMEAAGGSANEDFSFSAEAAGAERREAADGSDQESKYLAPPFKKSRGLGPPAAPAGEGRGRPRRSGKK